MEQAIEVFAIVNFLVIGFSHVFQHKAWAEFFVFLHGLGKPGAFANAFLSLFTGSLIVAFHNVWTGIPLVLTLLGWSMVVKAFIVFVAPDRGLKSIARVGNENSRLFMVPGLAMIVVAGALGYSIWLT